MRVCVCVCVSSVRCLPFSRLVSLSDLPSQCSMQKGHGELRRKDKEGERKGNERGESAGSSFLFSSAPCEVLSR